MSWGIPPHERIKSMQELKEEILQYIYDYSFEFGRYYHLPPAERDSKIKEKMLTPEEFINELL